MSVFLSGVAPGHEVALILALLLPVLAVPAWRAVRGQAALGSPWAVRLHVAWSRADTPTRWTVWLLLFTGVVHLGLPLGHAGSPLTTLAFLGSGVAYGWLALRAVTGRRWRRVAAPLLLGTLVAYTLNVTVGGEEPDQVGMLTAVVELAALGLALIPVFGAPGTVRRVLGRPAGGAFVVVVTLLFAATVWVSFAVGHDDHATAASSQARSADDHHHHDFLARLQAGIIMRPAGPPPTADQVAAANLLAERTRASTARYADIRTAEAEGYRNTGPKEGLQLHYEKKAHQADGRVADPEAPEQLVYAVEGGRTALLGVVYQMPVAGRPGPKIGGSTTRWHSHNICVGLLPPAFGPVSPFGTCPYLTAAVTIAEMMHVWVVDPPGGAYAEHIDDAWVRDLLLRTS